MTFSLEHASFTYSLVSRGLPVQVFPEVHLLVRLSVPRPHVTEHNQESQDDQTTKVWGPLATKDKTLLLTSCKSEMPM